MFVVGLTGGIGSGKSAVSQRFAALGVDVVDADVVARQVVEPGSVALAQIARHFGDEVLRDDGTLDRARLRAIVFADHSQREWLEGLLHPLIGAEIYRQLGKASSPYVLFVSPLLIEARQIDLCNRVLVVDAPESLQVERTMARDDNSAEQVRSIIASQTSREDRLGAADDVIVNDRDLAALNEAVDRLHRQYLELAAASAKEETPR